MLRRRGSELFEHLGLTGQKPFSGPLREKEEENVGTIAQTDQARFVVYS